MAVGAVSQREIRREGMIGRPHSSKAALVVGSCLFRNHDDEHN